MESGKKYIRETLSGLRYRNVGWIIGGRYGFPDIDSVIDGKHTFKSDDDLMRSSALVEKTLGVNSLFGFEVWEDHENNARIIFGMKEVDTIEKNQIKDYIRFLYPDTKKEKLNHLAERISNITDRLDEVHIQNILKQYFVL